MGKSFLRSKGCMHMCAHTYMSHHMPELGIGFIKPESLLFPTNDQTCTKGNSPLGVTSQHSVPLHVESWRCYNCRELLFSAMAEGDEAILNLNYIFNGNG